MNEQDFKALSNEERLAVIAGGLDHWAHREKIIKLLSSVSLEELDTNLLGELAKAYNNNREYEKAMAVLDRVAEEQRDARWYYRYGYSHSELAKNYNCDFETEAKKALEMLDKAVKFGDSEISNDCVNLIGWSKFDEILKDHKENFPHIAEKYAEYQNKETKTEKNMKPKNKKTYKKITIQDIANSDDTWDLTEPMYWTINIYKSYENYIKSAKIFTLEQRYLLAITWYFIEVNNGGHHQFFYNSTGIVYKDALNGFRLFEMPEFAGNLEKVVDYFGGNIPFDREQRLDMLEALEERNEEEFFNILDEADDFVYGYEGEENELNFAKAYPEKFLFEGEYQEV